MGGGYVITKTDHKRETYFTTHSSAFSPPHHIPIITDYTEFNMKYINMHSILLQGFELNEFFHKM